MQSSAPMTPPSMKLLKQFNRCWFSFSFILDAAVCGAAAVELSLLFSFDFSGLDKITGTAANSAKQLHISTTYVA